MRIVWNKEEKKAMQSCMVSICYDSPNLTAKTLMGQAQEGCIAPDRRVVINDQRVFNYKALVQGARDAARIHRKHIEEKCKQEASAPRPTAPIPVQLDTIGDLFEKLVEAITDRVLAKLNEKPPVEETITPAKLDETFDRLYPEWKEARSPMDRVRSLTIRPKSRRPTVLIVGLNGAQMEAIRTYKPDVDYTFVGTEQALSMRAVQRDHTILMTKFINHSVQGKYRKHPNLHFVNGGVSDLKSMLHMIFQKETV
jgi:hypothetical protein